MTNFEIDSMANTIRRLLAEVETLRLRNSELELELRALRSVRKGHNEVHPSTSAR